MGIISYFQNLYYDNKLEKAGRLLSEGRYSEAEDMYISLVDKHPFAATKLAEYYLSLSSSVDVRRDISLYKQTVDLKNKGINVYDAPSFDAILMSYVKHLRERSIICFEQGSFNDCVSLTSVLKETKFASEDVVILCAEAKIKLLFERITVTKVTSDSFYSLIEAFKGEWAICKARIRAKESTLQFCKQLEASKRYYASNLLLCIILNNSFDPQCLDNAVYIVKGNDSEATPNILKTVVSSYGKQIILRKDVSANDAVSIFMSCWEVSSDDVVVMDVLQSVKDSFLRDALINVIFKKHESYLSLPNLFNNFNKWLYDAFDSVESLKLLEKVHRLGYDVESYYTQKAHSWTSKMPYEDRLPFLDHVQRLFPDSSLMIEDKLSCAQHFLDNNDNEKAITVSDSIIGNCESAKLVKAQAFCNLASEEQDIDRRIEKLNQAQSSISSYSGSEKKAILTRIIDAFVLAAQSYYSGGDIDKSYTLLLGLAQKGYEKAAFAIANLRLHEVKVEKSIEEKLNKAIDAIGELRRFGISSIVKNPDYQNLWDEKIHLQIEKCKNFDNQSAVKHLESLIHEIDNAGFDATLIKEKRSIVLKQLIERKYLIARELELANDLSNASNLYKEINVLEAKRTPTLSAIRFIICKLKMQNNSDVLEHRERIYTILRKAAAAYKSEKDDIAYRFALILLKSGEDQEALSVLTEFLPNEDYLKKACEQGGIIKALAKLDDFNNKLESVKNKTLSSDDAVFFINHILEYAEIIRPVLDLPRTTLSKYRNTLKNYAIYKLFDEERYDIAFEKMIKEHKDFLDDYTALRNIALICLNMAESKQMTTANFKDVISIWLTAIYQEKLFVKSLDYTSWDDSYTFSLYEAYGHFNEDSMGALPNNVNFDDSDDDNIVFIKDVQRALLDRFEAAISDNQQYHEFFTSQKDAMDSFIALNLDEKCRLVAPYLAHKDEGLFQDISEALEEDRKQEYDNWEDLLSVGAIYQMPQAIYTDYNKAKSYSENCISAIDSLNSNDVKQAFLVSKIELIKRFKKLYSALKSYSNSKVSALSAKDKSVFKNNYSFYLVVCSSLKDTTLSFVFSNYVMQYVVGEVNSNSMKKSSAADYILSIFILDKNNTRVKENLKTLFEMLARDNSIDSSRAVTKILDQIRTIDAPLYNQLNKEKEQAKVDKELGDIVEKLTKTKSLSESAALQKLYSLYSSNPNNDAVCEILSQLCVVCIRKYIIDQEYGGSSVKTILEKLKNNMSSTFRGHRGHLKDAYYSFWNQIPADAKLALQGYNPNASLTSHGRAIKEGLDYFKSLGGVSDSNSLTDIFGF